MNHVIDEELEDKIADLEARLSDANSQLSVLSRERRERRSRAYIKANAITRDRVHVSSRPDVPWFGMAVAFGDWIARQPVKLPYAEWNGILYMTTGLLSGRMEETPAMFKHVPAKEGK